MVTLKYKIDGQRHELTLRRDTAFRMGQRLLTRGISFLIKPVEAV